MLGIILLMMTSLQYVRGFAALPRCYIARLKSTLASWVRATSTTVNHACWGQAILGHGAL